MTNCMVAFRYSCACVYIGSGLGHSREWRNDGPIVATLFTQGPCRPACTRMRARGRGGGVATCVVSRVNEWYEFAPEDRAITIYAITI